MGDRQHGEERTAGQDQQRRPLDRALYLLSVTLAAGVATWALSPIKLHADMGVLLAFMFVWNMVDAVVLIPELSYYLLPSGRARSTTPAATLQAASAASHASIIGGGQRDALHHPS